MFGLGIPELVVILVIALLVVGPAKLPQIGASLGGAIRGFRKAAGGEPVAIDQREERKAP